MAFLSCGNGTSGGTVQIAIVAENMLCVQNSTKTVTIDTSKINLVFSCCRVSSDNTPRYGCFVIKNGTVTKISSPTGTYATVTLNGDTLTLKGTNSQGNNRTEFAVVSVN